MHISVDFLQLCCGGERWFRVSNLFNHLLLVVGNRRWPDNRRCCNPKLSGESNRSGLGPFGNRIRWYNHSSSCHFPILPQFYCLRVINNLHCMQTSSRVIEKRVQGQHLANSYMHVPICLHTSTVLVFLLLSIACHIPFILAAPVRKRSRCFSITF